VETFTYRIDVTPERLSAALRPDWRRPTKGGDRFIDSDDSAGIRALHDELEQGARLRLHRIEPRADEHQRLWLANY
jgi:hypothetical protein